MNEPEIDSKVRKSQAPRRIKRVHIDYLRKQCLTILSREINALMDLSHERLLGKDMSLSLVNYIKLVRELEKQENSKSDETPTEVD
jgi:hypothetical protein